MESIPSGEKHSLLPVAIVPDDLKVEESFLPNRTSAYIVDDPFLRLPRSGSRNDNPGVGLAIHEAPSHHVTHRLSLIHI